MPEKCIICGQNLIGLICGCDTIKQENIVIDKTPEQQSADYLIDLHTTLVRMKQDGGFHTLFENLTALAENVERHLFENGLLTDRVFTCASTSHEKMLKYAHRSLIREEAETGFINFDDALYTKGVAVETFLSVHYPDYSQRYFTIPTKKG